MSEPEEKRVFAFFDGQNLFHAAKLAFGYSFPNYDPIKFAGLVCDAQTDWLLAKIHFYTGIPRCEDWRCHFWETKLASMGKNTHLVYSFTRPLAYRNGDGVGQEKGIDVRLALDVVRLAREKVFDVALIFSQDQDFSEVAAEVRRIAKEQQRWIKAASAYPVGENYSNKRGIEKTDWISIDKALYDRAIGPLRPSNRSGRLPGCVKLLLRDWARCVKLILIQAEVFLYTHRVGRQYRKRAFSE